MSLRRGCYGRFDGLLSPFFVFFALNPEFQAHLSYGGCSKTLRARNRLTSPQATNSRVAFLSMPR